MAASAATANIKSANANSITNSARGSGIDRRRPRNEHPRVNIDWSEGIKWYIAFLFSTTAHEAAHAWAALKLGDDTAYRGGQVTLDPTPHIRRSPVGMVVMPILSYIFGGWMIGWASAPFDPFWAIRNPRRSALMALAGPAANFILLIIAAIFIRAGLAHGVFAAPAYLDFSHVVEAAQPGWLFFARCLSIFFSLNLLLCTFNLLPFPPLDGSGALLIFCPPKFAEKVFEILHHPNLSFFGMFVAWKIFGGIFPYIYAIAAALLFAGVPH